MVKFQIPTITLIFICSLSQTFLKFHIFFVISKHSQNIFSQFQDTHDHEIKAVFLVPVSMGKIYLQADREGHIEVDGTLLVCLH